MTEVVFHVDQVRQCEYKDRYKKKKEEKKTATSKERSRIRVFLFFSLAMDVAHDVQYRARQSV